MKRVLEGISKHFGCCIHVEFHRPVDTEKGEEVFKVSGFEVSGGRVLICKSLSKLSPFLGQFGRSYLRM